MISSKCQVFIDKAEKTLSSFTSLKTQFVSISNQNFDISSLKEYVVATMQYSGDFDGKLTLLFPKKTAKIALESLLGKSFNTSDTGILKDGIGELCNIVMGAVKTQFDSQDIKIIFTLPQTSEMISKNIISNNGLCIDMQLGDNPFYMLVS